MENKKQLLRNLIFNIGSFIINLSISFFFTPYLIKTLGKETYSFFPLVNNMIGYTSILTTAVGSMAGRFITIKLYQNDLESAKKYFNSVFVANIILSFLFSITSVLVIINLSKILNIPYNLYNDIQLLFLFAAGAMIVNLVSSILGIGCFVKNRIDLNSACTTTVNMIRVVVILLLFLFLSPSIVYMSLSAFIASIITLVYSIYLKNKLLPEFTIRLKKYFSWNVLKNVISSGIWNSINQLSVVLLTQLDLLISNVFLGVSATGDYSIAKMIPTLIQSFIGVLVSVFIPHFTILYAKGNNKELIESVNKSIRLMGILVTIPIGFILINGESFFQLWVPDQDFRTLYWLSNISILPMIVTGSINTIFNVYTVTNKLRIPALVLLLSGIFNVIITIILLRHTNLGIWIIPLVSLVIGLLRNLIFTPIYAAYCLNEKWNVFYKAIFKGFMACMIVIFISYMINYFIIVDNWISFILSGILVLTTSICVNGIFFLDKEEMLFIFKKIRNEKNNKENY